MSSPRAQQPAQCPEDRGAANVDIEIEACGPRVNMLKADTVTAARVDDALKSGVKVVAGQNTMRAMKLTP